MRYRDPTVTVQLEEYYMTTKAYASFDEEAKFIPHEIERRELRENDVGIKILYCGICHSDIHTAKSEWGPAQYPCVPGHEIIGVVDSLGAKVTTFKVGDRVGVGCLVDSCSHCPSCEQHEEQYCKNGFTGTYGAQLTAKDEPYAYTMGGYSQNIVVNERFVLRVPEGLDLAGAAPLLCAGITTYSPLKHVGLSGVHRIAILGLGGLGHLAVKIAKSFGAHVCVISRSEHKREDSLRLGADQFLLSTDEEAVINNLETFDYILDTVSAPHDLAQALSLLKQDGTLIMVGASERPLDLSVFSLILRRRKILGSLIGGLKETQEMLDHCARHNITSDIELIAPSEISSAYDRVLASDVKYRFVIDCQKM